MSNQILIKSTMSDMRAITTSEINDLQTGVYESIMLLGYYVKGDTHAPIIYNITDTTDTDDKGSIIEVHGIKLEHIFTNAFHSSYFGNDFTACCYFSNKRNIPMILDQDINISTTERNEIVCPRGIFLSGSKLTIDGHYTFNLDTLNDSLEIRDGIIEVTGVNSSASVNHNPERLFSFSASVPAKQLQSLVMSNVEYIGSETNANGSTRARGIINARNFSQVNFSDCIFSNCQYGTIIRNSSNVFFYNCKFSNVDTGVYADTVTNLLMRGCELRNTVEQSNNWMGKETGTEVNGKDLIFATGNNITISNNKVFYPIERCCYVIANDVIIENNYSLNGDGFKAVGNYGIEGGIKKNVLIVGNTLEIDNNIVNMGTPIVGFTQIYMTENNTIKDNVMRVLFEVPVELRRHIRFFASFSRGGKNTVIEGNIAEICSDGFIFYNLKNDDEISQWGQYVHDGLKIINNTISAKNWVEER